MNFSTLNAFIVELTMMGTIENQKRRTIPAFIQHGYMVHLVCPICKSTVIFWRIITTFNQSINDSAQLIQIKEQRGMDNEEQSSMQLGVFLLNTEQFLINLLPACTCKCESQVVRSVIAVYSLCNHGSLEMDDYYGTTLILTITRSKRQLYYDDRIMTYFVSWKVLGGWKQVMCTWRIAKLHI